MYLWIDIGTHKNYAHPHTAHTIELIEYQESVKAAQAETGTDSSAETSQLLKQLGLLPTTSHIQTTKGSSESTEQVDNTRPEPEKEKETEEKKDDNGNIDDSAFLPSERPVQKNKKKCWVCKTKLELAQRELGGCKCGKCMAVCVCVCMYNVHVCVYVKRNF